jgi:tyrosine-protein kinase Etk/Wzc
MQQSTINSRNTSEDDDIDLRKIFSKLLPHWYVFVICLVMGLAGAYLINILKEPVYRVNSTLLVREDRPIMPLMGAMEMFSGRNNLFNETGILRSYSLIDSALQNLDVRVSYYLAGPFRRTEIYIESPFRVEFDYYHPQPFDEVFTLSILDGNSFELSGKTGLLEERDEKKRFHFGQRIRSDKYSFTVNKVNHYELAENGNRAYQFIIHDPRELSAIYREDLTVDPVRRESSLIELSFKSTNLQKALDFVNMLTATFIYHDLQEKNQTSENTIRFIDNQLMLTSGSLYETESRLQDFREEQQLMDISLVAAQLMNELQILDKERSIEEVKQNYYDFLLEYVSDKRDFSEVFGPSALGIDDPLLNNLLMELSKLHTERSRLLLSTTARSPSVQAVDQNIKQVKATLEENIKSIRSASDMLMTNLNRRIRQIEVRSNELPRTERELLGIKRMFNVNDATYNLLLEKQAEAGILLASNIPNHKVVDRARFDLIVSPNKHINYALGLILGLLLPFSFFIIRDYFNVNINNKETITRAVRFPIVGIIPRFKPHLKAGSDLVVFDQPFAPISEAFRSIRSNLQFLAPRNGNNLIVFTSTRSGEGKTFTALNLAGVLALANKRTLYINADIRKSHLRSFNETKTEDGLTTYLIGRSHLKDIIVRSSHNVNLDIINSGLIPPNPAELIESSAMKRLLQKELKEYEYVIIDTSPIGLVADAQSLMAIAGVNVFVLRHNYSQHSDLDFIKEYSAKAELSNIVITVNDIKQSKKGFGYGYGHGYGYGYGYNPVINGKGGM